MPRLGINIFLLLPIYRCKTFKWTFPETFQQTQVKYIEKEIIIVLYYLIVCS